MFVFMLLVYHGDFSRLDGERADVRTSHRTLPGASERKRDRPAHTPGSARDERYVACAFEANDLVVDLSREQAERQADHARAMRQHPFDREMGLAGVGWAQNGR